MTNNNGSPDCPQKQRPFHRNKQPITKHYLQNCMHINKRGGVNHIKPEQKKWVAH